MKTTARALLLALTALAATACDDGGDDPPDATRDGAPPADATTDAGPDALLDGDISDTAPPIAAPVGPAIELCVACGDAASATYRLTGHSLRPVESAAPRAAESAQYRLILDVR